MRWVLAGALAFALFLFGAAGWLLYTEAGLRWAAAYVEEAAQGKLRLEGLRGALAREIQLDLLHYQDEAIRVELRAAAVQLELLAILGARAGIESLRAKSLDIGLRASGGGQRAAAPPPVPFGLRVGQANIERITLGEYVVERFALRDAALLQSGVVSASVAFELKHGEYPVSAQLKLGGTIARLEVAFEGAVAGVPASARAIVAPLEARALQALDAQAGPLDLSRLNPQWPRTELSMKLSGKAGADHALAGRLSARNAAPGPLDDGRVPLSALETRFATPDFGSVSLQELKASLSPGGTLAGSGMLRAGRAAFDVQVADLNLRGLYSSLHPTRLSGSLRLTAAETQTLQGTLAQDDIRISAHIVRNADRVEIRSVRAEAQGGAATGSGRRRLGEPLRFEARLRLEHFDPARFGEYPEGDINGALDASGALGADPAVNARWVIEGSTFYGEALESRGAARFSRTQVSRMVAQAKLGGARFTARGEFGRPGDKLEWALEVPRLEHFLDDAAGRVQASGTLSGTFEEPQLSLSAEAKALRLPQGIELERAAAKASGNHERHVAEVSLRAKGFDVSARVRGGWHKDAGWSGELLALRNSGTYPFDLLAPVAVRVAPGRAELGSVEGKLGQGHLSMSELAWSESGLSSSGKISGLPAQWLVRAAGLDERIRSTMLLDGQWNIASSPRLNGSATLRRSAGELTLIEGGTLELGLKEAAVNARFNDGHISAAAQVASKYASATVKADIAPEPGAPGLAITPQSALSLDARIGPIDLGAVLQPMLEEARIAGRANAELRASGTLAEPRIAGTLQADALGFEVPPLGVFLKSGRLRAALEGDTLHVSEFSIQGGSGTLTASGTLPLRMAQGGARLAWRADKFDLLQRTDLRLSVSGSGEARIVEERVSLSGALRADRGYLELGQDRLPKLGDDVVVIGQERPALRKATQLPVALDLQLDLGNDLRVRGYSLEGKITGQLQVQTTRDGELRAYGRISTVNATVSAYGQQLIVDPGVIIFDGPLDNPSLQVTAWRRNQQVEVGVQVSGSARAPRVQLVSTPPVSESERLSWLVLGRGPTEAGKNDLGLLQAAAGALFSGGDEVSFDRRLARTFGADEITLRGSGATADQVVAVGKRLSDQVYVSYEQGLGAAASSLVKLDLSLTQGFSVRAETGTSSGVGLFYRRWWD